MKSLYNEMDGMLYHLQEGIYMGITIVITCCSDMSRMSRNAPGDSEADNYKYETPNNTIMIRGLAQHITENDVSVCIFSMQQ
jgi:hypothetical protein